MGVMLCTDEAGRRTPDAGQWTMDAGRWTMDAGPSAPYYKLTGENKKNLFKVTYEENRLLSKKKEKITCLEEKS